MRQNFYTSPLIVFFVSLFGCFHADANPKFSAKIIGLSSIVIKDDNQNRKINFHHSVDGYAVNCEKIVMAVWGKPINLNINNPQDSDLTIVDLHNLQISRELSFSAGIFGVDFLSAKSMIFVDTGAGLVVNYITGKYSPAPTNQDYNSDDFPRQSCDDFSFKSYHRRVE